MTTLRTERLLLRQWRDSDREPWAALNADPEVMRYFPSTLSEEQSDDFVDRHHGLLAVRGWGLWAAEVADGPAFIGFVGLNEPGFEADFTPCVEVGWRLAAPHWGRGYAPEGARAALAFAFGELGLDDVVSFTAVGNSNSRRVMEKIGMAFEREFDHPSLADGDPIRRHALYRIERPS